MRVIMTFSHSEQPCGDAWGGIFVEICVFMLSGCNGSRKKKRPSIHSSYVLQRAVGPRSDYWKKDYPKPRRGDPPKIPQHASQAPSNLGSLNPEGPIHADVKDTSREWSMDFLFWIKDDNSVKNVLLSVLLFILLEEINRCLLKTWGYKKHAQLEACVSSWLKK